MSGHFPQSFSQFGLKNLVLFLTIFLWGAFTTFRGAKFARKGDRGRTRARASDRDRASRRKGCIAMLFR